MTRAEARARRTRRQPSARPRSVRSRRRGAKEVEDADRELVDAEAALAEARAGRSAAEMLAGRATVRATFDGIVARRLHNPGDLVEASASDPVLRVIDPLRLEVDASVPIADVSRSSWARRRGSSLRADAAAEALKVVSRPAAVEAGHGVGAGAARVRRATTLAGGNAGAGGHRRGSSTQNVVLVPAEAIVREGDETAVFVAAGDKAQRRPVVLGLADREHVEVRSGVKAGELVIIAGQAGLPDGAAIRVGDDRREMSVAAQALRHSRAAALIAVALVVAGAIAAFSLPSSIYPPLQFPRIVIIAHSGTLPSQSMMLTVTRPLEQAVMEVPGIRRVRSTKHPRRGRDLGAVRSGHRHGRRAAAGAEPGGGNSRRAARRHRARRSSA